MITHSPMLDALSYVAAVVVLGILWWRLFLTPRTPPTRKPAPPMDDPRTRIRRLAKRGRTVIDIAAELGISRGEVELVLALPYENTEPRRSGEGLRVFYKPQE
jgi:hypothetical protein